MKSGTRMAMRAMLLGMTVGGLCWAADLALLVRHPPEGLVGLAAGLLGLLLVAGAALGLVAAAFLSVGDWLTPRLRPARVPAWLARALMDAALAVPVVLLVGRKVFAGRGLAASALRSSGPWIFLAVALTCVAVASVVLRAIHRRVRGPWRAVTAAAALCVAVVLVMAERTQPIDAYFYLHVTALLLGAITVMIALDPLLPRLHRAVAPGAALGALALLVVLDPTTRLTDRLIAYNRPLVAGRITHGLRLIWDRDGDGFSPVFGGGDCDDAAPDVNPLALDAPGDGVDQDCDGADATAAPPPPPGGVCVDPPELVTAREALRGASLLVVIVDALRGDRLDLDPASSPMPFLARLAARGVRFRTVISMASSTSWVIPASFAGRMRAAPSAPTLVEALRQAGYHTGMAVLDDTERVLGPLLERFDKVASLKTEKAAVSIGSGVTTFTGDDLTRAALGFVDEAPRDRPFALVVHYMAAHQWYRLEDPDIVRAGEAGGDVGRYDAVLGKLDGSLGDLLRGLEQRGLGDRLLTVVLADHGEGLGTRQVQTHGRHVYPVLSHVPLIIAGPGIAARRIDATVGLIDLAPTLTDLLGTAPIPGAEGRSLAPLALGPPQPECDRPVFTLDVLQAGVAWRDRMLVVMPFVNAVELLDLRGPPPAPGQSLIALNLAEEEPETTAMLLGWVRQRFSPAASAPVRPTWQR